MKVHAIIDNTASPDVHQTGVIDLTDMSGEYLQTKKVIRLTFRGLELFWSDVRLAPTQSRGHVHRFLPWKAINGRCTVISDLGLEFQTNAK